MVLRHFAYPTLTYLASFLPVPADTMEAVRRASWRFLWSGKKAKANPQTCKTPPHLGGLGYPDFGDVVPKLQAKWAVRLLRDWNSPAPWVPLAKWAIGHINKSWMHGPAALATPSTHEAALSSPSTFWANAVWEFWQLHPTLDTSTTTPEAAAVLARSTLLFRNRKVLHLGKPLCTDRWKPYLDAGVHRIDDLMENGTFMDHAAFVSKYQKVTFSSYAALLAAIPPALKAAASAPLPPNTPIHNLYPDKILIGPSPGTKALTAPNRSLSHTPTTPLDPKGEDSWNLLLRPPPQVPPNWQTTYRRMAETKVPNKWKDLWWLVLRRSVHTGAIAQRTGWSGIPHTCLHCGALETIEHLFYHCARAQHCWTWCRRRWKASTRRSLTVTPELALLGGDRLWNVLAAATLQAIWRARNQEVHDPLLTPVQALPILTNTIQKHLKILHHLKTPLTPFTRNGAFATVAQGALIFSQ